MSQRDVRAYLFDIAEACRLVLEFTRTRSAGDYATDPMLRSAVERQLEIMGEALAQALRHHPGLLAGRIPEAPRIIAFRNQLVHGYASVVDDIVWAIVERDVPALRDTVVGLLAAADEKGADLVTASLADGRLAPFPHATAASRAAWAWSSQVGRWLYRLVRVRFFEREPA